MKYREYGDIVAVRLDVGDELVDCVRGVCSEMSISAAYITGIGAVKSAVTGVFDVSTGKYSEHGFNEFMELVSLTGNASVMNDETYIHLHACFGRSDGSAVGGHLKSAVVGATGEVFIRRLSGVINRRVCDETGLNVFDF